MKTDKQSIAIRLTKYLGSFFFTISLEILFSFAILVLFIFTNTPIQKYYLEVDLTVSLPIALSIVTGWKEMRNYFDLFVFDLILRKELLSSINSLHSAIEKESLDVVLSKYNNLTKKLEFVSKTFKLGESDLKFGHNTFNYFTATLSSLEPDNFQSVDFRRPIYVGVLDQNTDLMHYLAQEHIFIKHLRTENGSKLAQFWCVFSLNKYLNKECPPPSQEFLEKINHLLYFLSIKQTSILEFQNSKISQDFTEISELFIIDILRLFSNKEQNILKSYNKNIGKYFIGWLTFFDLATRGKDNALDNSTEFVFNNMVNNGESLDSLAKELAENIVADRIKKHDAINGLKAFIKLSIPEEKKILFLNKLKEEFDFGSSASQVYNDLIENFLLYLSIQKTISAIDRANLKDFDFKVSVDVSLNEDPKANFPLDCLVEFKDKNGKEITTIPRTSLLFDRNALSRTPFLNEIESLTEKNVTVVNLKIYNGPKISILTWPFGVTSTESTFMAIWPPTIDTFLFVNILAKEKYFSSPSKVLDMGSGSGILALFALSSNAKNKVISTDINRECEKWIRANRVINDIQKDNMTFKICNSIACLSKYLISEKLDFLLLSPPYLPLFLVKEPLPNTNKFEDRFATIFDEYSIETMDTGLLYDAIVNFKNVSEKLIVLYSSIADDVVTEAMAYVRNKGVALSQKILFEGIYPLKIKGLIPLNESDLKEWGTKKPQELNRILDLRKRRRLIPSPSGDNNTYPFWHKLKIVEIS